MQSLVLAKASLPVASGCLMDVLHVAQAICFCQGLAALTSRIMLGREMMWKRGGR